MSAATAMQRRSKRLPADRIHQTLCWILDGASEHDIEEAIRANWPDATARPLITAAISEIAKAGEADREILRGWCVEATRRIFQKAAEVGDHATALAAIRQIHQLAKK
jgi:hypothetical protein